MTLTTPMAEMRPVTWQRTTLAEELRLQLADEIVRGSLAPGAALDETTLARRFEVSRTPVREAIRLLAASGLVERAALHCARHPGVNALEPSNSPAMFKGDGGTWAALLLALPPNA